MAASTWTPATAPAAAWADAARNARVRHRDLARADRGARRRQHQDIARGIPGVDNASPPGMAGAVSYRGFSGSQISQFNGISVQYDAIAARPIDSWIYDRVEAIGGPSTFQPGAGAGRRHQLRDQAAGTRHVLRRPLPSRLLQLAAIFRRPEPAAGRRARRPRPLPAAGREHRLQPGLGRRQPFPRQPARARCCRTWAAT